MPSNTQSHQDSTIPNYAQVTRPTQRQPDPDSNTNNQSYAQVTHPQQLQSDSPHYGSSHESQLYGNIDYRPENTCPSPEAQHTSDSGWTDNTLYESSSDGTSLVTTPESVTIATRSSQGWMDNSLYDEYDDSKQLDAENEQQEQEGWVDNSIYNV